MTPIEKIKEVVNQLDDNSTGDDFYGVGCAVESICRNVQLEDNDSNISPESFNFGKDYSESVRKVPSNFYVVRDFVSLPHHIIDPPNSTDNIRANVILNEKLITKGLNEPYSVSKYISDKNAICKKSLEWERKTTITYKTTSNAPICSNDGKSVGSISTDIDSINVKFLK